MSLEVESCEWKTKKQNKTNLPETEVSWNSKKKKKKEKEREREREKKKKFKKMAVGTGMGGRKQKTRLQAKMLVDVLINFDLYPCLVLESICV